jgi:hypothetical protein
VTLWVLSDLNFDARKAADLNIVLLLPFISYSDALFLLTYPANITQLHPSATHLYPDDGRRQLLRHLGSHAKHHSASQHGTSECNIKEAFFRYEPIGTAKLMTPCRLAQDDYFHIGVHPTSYQMGQCGRGVKLTTHLQLVPRSRKCGPIQPFPHTPSWHTA